LIHVALVLALSPAPTSASVEKMPTTPEEMEQFDFELMMPINQMAAPWMSLSFTYGGAVGPVDISVRPRMAIGLLWDALELGGTVIAGANIAQFYSGGGVFVNWTPVPYRAGHIVYTHAGAGRLHTITPHGPRLHLDYLRFALGFRIHRRPQNQPLVPWFELGYNHLRHCADWDMPCGWAGVALWAPWLEIGVRYK
jgi:hypothetical protein